MGAVVAGTALGLTVGVYEVCWTLLLDRRGAAAWQVGLSWTLFAVPFALLARPGGYLADHVDRRRAVVVTVALTLGFCATYPFVPSLAWLLGMGAAEAAGVAIALPSMQSLLTEDGRPGELGRVQGLFASAQTAAIALAAVLSGVLFAVRSWAPFVGAAVIGGLLVALLPWIWSSVPGRVPRGVAPEDGPPADALGRVPAPPAAAPTGAATAP